MRIKQLLPFTNKPPSHRLNSARVGQAIYLAPILSNIDEHWHAGIPSHSLILNTGILGLSAWSKHLLFRKPNSAAAIIETHERLLAKRLPKTDRSWAERERIELARGTSPEDVASLKEKFYAARSGYTGYSHVARRARRLHPNLNTVG